MARPKGSTNKPKKTAEVPNPGTVDMLAAVEFVAGALRNEGSPNECHCQLANGTVTSFNGLYGYGIRLPSSDLSAFPHGLKFVAALKQCKGEVQITHLDNDRLAVQAKGFKAFVPCLPHDALAPIIPDGKICDIDDKVKTSLEVVSEVAAENATRVVEAAVLLQSGSAIATDGHLLMEHWHGFNVPSLTIPKVAVARLSAVKRQLTGLGVSWDSLGKPRSATFWFGDEAFFKTQLYADEYPSVTRITGLETNGQKKVPADLAEALDGVDAFSNEAGDIYFDAQSVRTELDAVTGAVRDIAGELPAGKCHSLDLLRMILPHAKTVEWTCGERKDVAVFHGDNFRAFLMERKINAV